MYTNRVSRLVARSGILIVLCLVSSISTSQVVDLAEQELLIKKACPKQWEGLYSSIELNPNVLDIWRGDLSDKAQFIQYANAEGRNGRPRLLGENGQLLIDDYNDVITIMAECGAQRVLYYKSVRERVGASISGMVSKLEDHTAFGRSGVSTGVAYDNWVELTTGEGEEVVEVPFNLAIGRNTTQSGTSSDDLSDTETERSEDEYADLAEAQGYAIKAVDNDIDGNFANGSVTHTGFQNEPYWEVDLDQINRINSIEIFNRMDCCSERLSNFTVIVSTRPLDARKLDEALAIDGVVWSQGFASFQGVATTHDVDASSQNIELPANTLGRYVRIQLAGNNKVLSLAEVRVIGNALKNDL